MRRAPKVDKRRTRRICTLRALQPPELIATSTAFEGLLTRRELEVLANMAEGETNAEIAHHLVIAESTVKSHVKNILRKLSATNRTEAVGLYFEARDVRARDPDGRESSLRGG